MKKHRLKLFFLGLIAAFFIDAGKPAYAFNLQAALAKNAELLHYEETIGNERPIGNEELDNMRGGFVTRNGMIIDFSFSANTLVDGQLINQIVLNAADLADSAGLFKSVIQIGEANQAFGSTTDMNALPDVLTVVQNNIDNLTIQQLNFLDLNVQNVNNFINQSFTPELNFQSAIGLAP